MAIMNTENKTSILFKDKMGMGSTSATKEFFEESLKSAATVRIDQVWAYGDLIPHSDGATIETIRKLPLNVPFEVAISEGVTIPLIVKRELEFSKISNSIQNAFVLKDGDSLVKDVIPFNFYEDVYNYELTTSSGIPIPFGVGNWIFDTHSSVLTFYGEMPRGVSLDELPKFKFYQYVGGRGLPSSITGREGALIPISGIELKKGTFSFESVNATSTLQNYIIDKCNEIEDGYVRTYGWDGSDENVGVGIGLSILTPLYDFVTNDIVKGHDKAKNSSIYALLSRRYIKDPTDIISSGLTPTFVSPNMPLGTHTLTIESLPDGDSSITSIWIDNCPAKTEYVGLEDLKISLGNEFIYVSSGMSVVTSASDTNDPNVITFEVTEDGIGLEEGEDPLVGKTTCALFYWDIASHEYAPYRLNEDGSYRIAFPVIHLLGKIPPSIKLNTNKLSLLEDSITPDYYGPRIHSIVICNEGVEGDKSADYVTRPKDATGPGVLFDDILVEAYNDNKDSETFEIYLRNGTYEIVNNLESLYSLGISKPMSIIGESLDGVIIKSSSGFKMTPLTTGLFNISGITFENISLDLTDNFVINNITCGSLTVSPTSTGAFTVTNSSFSDITVESEVPSETSHFYIEDNTIGELVINDNGIIRNNTINAAEFNTQCTVTGNTIQTLYEKVESAIFRGNYVITVDENIEDRDGIRSPNKFPIYNSEGLLKYAQFNNPIVYDDKKHEIKLAIDARKLIIKEDGVLSVIDSTGDDTYIDLRGFKRDPSFEKEYEKLSEEQKTPHKDFIVFPETPKTLTEVLKYIFEYKADLVSGKIPIDQLPDAVAYGGLTYCGLWSIEQKNSLPLKPEDFSNYEDVLKVNYPHIEDIQPGWFVIVDKSSAVGDPLKIQKIDGDDEEYTAGDWIIWNGSKWEKIDRAYQNPIYTPLPSTTPSGKSWSRYSEENTGTGALDLGGKPLVDAVSDINDELSRLSVKRPPYLNEFDLLYDTDSFIDYCTTTFSNNFLIVDPPKTAINRDVVKTLSFVNSNGEDWKSYIYYGHRADFSVMVKHDQDQVVDYRIKDYVGIKKSDLENKLTLSAKEDPYKNEHAGAGYWEGTKLSFVLDDIQDGTYKIVATEENISLVGRTDTTQKSTGEVNVSFMSNKIPEPNITSFTLKPEDARYATGLMYLESNTDEPSHKCSLRIEHAVHSICNEKIFALRINGVDYDYSYITKYSNVSFFKEKDDYKDFFEVRITNLPVYNLDGIIGNKVPLEFEFISYDLYGDEYISKVAVDTKYLPKDYIDPRRVCSGIGSMPVYDVYQDNFCGSQLDQTLELSDQKSSELLQIFDEERNSRAYVYPTLASQEFLLNKTIDYSEVEGTRYLTLNLGSVKDVNGFNIVIDAEGLSVDTLSCGYTNISFDVYVTEDGHWYDANKPIGFIHHPNADGDACMYAGYSSVSNRRVSFGTKAVSGDVIIRIGTSDKEVRIYDINLEV